MQCVILAAGRGTRMEELTGNTPKPMLLVEGKPLLEYKLDALPDEVDEVVFIIGYLGAVVREHFGERYGARKISYVEQKELNGTADALWRAKDLLRDQFLVMNADDIYAGEDMEQMIAPGDHWRLLVQQKEHMNRSGNVELDAEGDISAIAEGDWEDTSGLASTNMFLLDTRVFSQQMVRIREGYPEFGLPQTIIASSKALHVRIEPIFTDAWIEVNAPNDLVRAAEILKERPKKPEKPGIDLHI